MAATRNWQALGAGKKASTLAKIPASWRLPEAAVKDIHEASDISVLDVPQSCGLLSEDELHITGELDASGLLEQLAAGKLKSYDVSQAFCKRAAIAHQLTNCLTEIFFEEALQRAKELDDHLERENKPAGPLHGLPVSLKDSFNVKGIQSTCGYISFLDHPPASQNSAIVQILLNLGAVLYVKTNVPQSFMTADSENNVFGRTLNPYRLSITAGGSTGGEGALIAMRGSVLGMATDIAGSIRIPALCNGVLGFKPTVNRIPLGGNATASRFGSPSPILPLAGPIATSIRDIELLIKAVIDTDPWKLDEATLGVPWREVAPSAPTRKLRLGLITEDPAFPLHPPTLRAIRTAVQKLESAGHIVIPLDASVPSLESTAKLAWLFFKLDPAKTALRHIQAGGEPLIKSLSTARFPEQDSWEPSVEKLFSLNNQRRAILKTYKDLLVLHRLDAILMPPFHATAVPHDTYGTAPYTVLANLLDWPAAVMPFLNAKRELDEPFVREGMKYVPPYRPEEVEGLPCSVQMLGRPMRDEELLRDLEVVARVLES